MYCSKQNFFQNRYFKVNNDEKDLSSTYCETWDFGTSFCAVCHTDDQTIAKRTMKFTNFTVPLNIGKNMKTKGICYYSHSLGWLG